MNFYLYRCKGDTDLSTNDIKLIALDIDGTLINSKGEISTYTKRVINEAQKKNTHIVLTTGRPFPFCTGIANQLDITSYIITNNGAEIWKDESEVIARHFMNPNRIEELWQIGNHYDLLTWMVSPTELFRHSTRPKCFLEFEWLKFGFGNLNEKMMTLLQHTLSRYDDLEVTSSSLTNIEINCKGVNKIVALKKVCHKLNIPLENVMAIGDNLNDLQMIKQVGYGIAVDNALVELKETARYVTTSNDEDGVAQAIEKYVLS